MKKLLMWLAAWTLWKTTKASVLVKRYGTLTNPNPYILGHSRDSHWLCIRVKSDHIKKTTEETWLWSGKPWNEEIYPKL